VYADDIRMMVNVKALTDIVVNVLQLTSCDENYVTEMRRCDDTAEQSVAAVSLAAITFA